MNNRLGESSNADTIISIVKIVIPLMISGYTAYKATKTAQEQLAIQGTLNTQVVNGIAMELWKYYNAKYPQLTVQDWIVFIQFGGDPSIPNGNDDTPKATNYWIYLAIFVIVSVVTKK